MPKKNVNINLDVEDIYTKQVKKDSEKGGKIYVHKSLVGKKVVVLSLKNGKKVKKIKTRKIRKDVCKRCNGIPRLCLPPYQRNRVDIKICDCNDPDI